MPTQTTFLGASIINYTTGIGYNGQGSTQVAARLVEDPDNGDSFAPPTVGTPVTFNFGNFSYRGILQHWEAHGDTGGFVKDVLITDCAEILSGTVLIINSYNGPRLVDNVINIYGYMELPGFGFSGTNDAGMYYSTVSVAINELVNNNANSTYGGPITFKGFTYRLDLSQLPAVPAFYRVGGDTHISLMDMISQVCFDGGFDFYLTLTEDNVITVKTISRNYTPSLNKIQQFITSQEGSIVRKSVGRELRNEVTSAFLLGADQLKIHTTVNQIGNDTIWPYWGLDADGDVIIGEGYGNEHTVDLNCESISEIVGSNIYTCSVLEMRFAMIDENSWMVYVQRNKPSLANYLGLTPKYDIRNAQSLLFESDLINIGRTASRIAAQIYESDHQNRIYKVYEFVRTYATEFYGKKWLVRIPFVTRKLESDTGKILYSLEPTASAYFDSNAAPIGLDREAAELFKDNEDRFFPFMRYFDIGEADLSHLRLGADAVISNGSLYVRCDQQPKVVYAGGIPCVVCELPVAIYEAGSSPIGDAELIAQLFQTSIPTIERILKNRSGGFFDIAVHPAAIGPDAAAVTLKSNTDCYGPWIKAGPAGKVEYRRDIDLAPWNYNGYYALELVARATIESIVTNMQEGETGFVTVVGEPLISIGDALIAGGPNVTSMDVEVGDQGITTTYKMRTFTPRIGGYNKQFIEQFRRMIMGQQERRQESRKLLAEALSKLVPPTNGRALDYFRYKMKEVRPHSPHPVLSCIVEDNDGQPRVKMSTLTHGEAWVNSNVDDETLYSEQTAYMGLEGLFRPLSTDMSGDFDGWMPVLEVPSSGFTTESILTSQSLNPFLSSDIDVYSYGDEFTFGNYNDGSPGGNARMIGLRGPLILAGWGYGIDGTGPSGLLETGNYLRDFSSWKAGPVDLLWDQKRKVWTSHTLIPGKTSQTFNTKFQTGTVRIYKPDQTISTHTYQGMMFHNGTVASGVDVLLTYCPTFNKLLIISADC